jgi:hypothetical protein
MGMDATAQAKTEIVDFPGFKYGVFEIPGGKLCLSLYADVGSNEPACVLATKSSPLADKVAFYTIGRDLALGSEQAEALPQPVKRVAKSVYEDCQARSMQRDSETRQGTWHKDGGFVEGPLETILGNLRPGNGYTVARYFQNIEGFTDRMDVIATPETREERLWLPVGDGRRYILPIVGQNTRFGLPQATTDDFSKAVRAFADALGVSEEQAKHHVSRFSRVRRGLFAVCSESYSGNGALCVILTYGPLSKNGAYGSFPLSRVTNEVRS